MPATLSISEFLEKASFVPVIDVRSPGEYLHAHIPNAFNIPLLNNENRKEVGITYKNFGREKAVQVGFDLVGDKFGNMIREAEKIAPEKEILVYCWRGGMRSGVMAWLLETAGFKTFLLKGGYKSFRNHVLEILQQEKNIIIIGGKTGTGKTEIIKQLAKQNEQTIDLENLANHKGSAFGHLGCPPQPSNEMFENLLAAQWNNTDSQKILYLENESIAIGNLKIPNSIFSMMKQAMVIEIEIPFEWRVKNILDSYGTFPKEELIASTGKLKKRLGNQRMREAIQCLQNNDFEKWVAMMLEYYDKFYAYGMGQREKNKIYQLSFLLHDYKKIAKEITTIANEEIKNNVSFDFPVKR